MKILSQGMRATFQLKELDPEIFNELLQYEYPTLDIASKEGKDITLLAEAISLDEGDDDEGSYWDIIFDDGIIIEACSAYHIEPHRVIDGCINYDEEC